jgi:hypothetical protein
MEVEEDNVVVEDLELRLACATEDPLQGQPSLQLVNLEDDERPDEIETLHDSLQSPSMATDSMHTVALDDSEGHADQSHTSCSNSVHARSDAVSEELDMEAGGLGAPVSPEPAEALDVRVTLSVEEFHLESSMRSPQAAASAVSSTDHPHEIVHSLDVCSMESSSLCDEAAETEAAEETSSGLSPTAATAPTAATQGSTPPSASGSGSGTLRVSIGGETSPGCSSEGSYQLPHLATTCSIGGRYLRHVVWLAG